MYLWFRHFRIVSAAEKRIQEAGKMNLQQLELLGVKDRCSSMDGMASLLQNLHRSRQVRLIYEQVIRVECRNGEDADPGLGQGNCQRGEDADDRERHGPGHTQTAPAPLAEDSFRHGVLATHDG